MLLYALAARHCDLDKNDTALEFRVLIEKLVIFVQLLYQALRIIQPVKTDETVLSLKVSSSSWMRLTELGSFRQSANLCGSIPATKLPTEVGCPSKRMQSPSTMHVSLPLCQPNWKLQGLIVRTGYVRRLLEYIMTTRQPFR